MRCLERNKRTIHYALYLGKAPILDDDGNDTGETVPSYSDPVEFKINTSPASGESATRQFGEIVDYDRTLVTTNTTLPIDENSILWIDESDTSKPYDYIVKKVAKGLNSILFAVKKVKVSTDA